MSRLSFIHLATALLLVSCAAACGDSSQAAAPPTAPVAAPPAPVQPPPTTPAPAQAGASNFGTISLAPGFVPDPHVASGTSGGSVAASSMNATCAGWVSSTPDHLFVSTGSFASLRILASATEDVTLVIQRPDGTYTCNDDTEGTNPIVSGAFPAGTYKIWVGSYAQGASAAYRLGVSELTSTTAASLSNG